MKKRECWSILAEKMKEMKGWLFFQINPSSMVNVTGG